MRTKPNPESVVREIRPKTPKKYSAEEKHSAYNLENEMNL
jgi:hypothetical protein